MTDSSAQQRARFATGCFWCTQAAFSALTGVCGVVCGYSGGSVEHPDYKAVCTGTTGHAECVDLTFNTERISYLDLLKVFFTIHDPTSLNKQGEDVGTQYRSAIFYYTDEQKDLATRTIDELNQSGVYRSPIVTEVVKASTFWPAEDYHQNYFANNPTQGYCTSVIAPKIKKFKQIFKDKLKSE